MRCDFRLSCDTVADDGEMHPFRKERSLTYFFVAPECLGALWSRLGIDTGIASAAAVLSGIAGALLFAGIFLKKEKGKY